MDAPQMVEFRCPTSGCGKLLFKVSSVAGIAVEARCPRCKNDVAATLAASGDKTS